MSLIYKISIKASESEKKSDVWAPSLSWLAHPPKTKEKISEVKSSLEFYQHMK